MKKGSQARLVQPVVQGKVIAVKYDQDTDTKSMCLEYKDALENVQTVWFEEDQLEEVPA